MTHDPLCPLGQPCHALGGDDHLLYKAYEGLTACDCCDRTCCCDVIAKVRADERAKLVEVMGQVSHQSADQGNRITVFAGKPVNGSVLVWQDGQYVWVNPR